MSGADMGGRARIDTMDAAELYRAVPARNSASRTRRTAGGLVVETPLDNPTGARRILWWLAPGPSCRSVRLDELGESVFRDCDGRKTVREIILRFAGEHRLTFIESRTLIVLFLKRLMERGAIAALLGEENEGN